MAYRPALDINQLFSITDEEQFANFVNFYSSTPTSLNQLVNALFDSLVGGKFHEQTNYIFQNPRAISVIFSVLPHLNEQGQMDLLDRYIVLLEECTVDRAISSAVGLISKIVNLLSNEQYSSRFSPGVTHKLIQLIGTLGSYSISVNELKALLRLLRTKEEDALDPDLSPFLLDVIRKMTTNSCPSSFFNFDGNDCGLQMDEFYFPSAGYTFCSWIRIERTSQQNYYRFFSIFDTKGNGLELLFKGNHAVVQVSNGRRVTRVTLDPVLHTNRWYFISFSQNKKFLTTSELQVHIDGELKQKTELRYPPLPAVTQFNHFGTNVPYHNIATQVHSFCGQSGPIAFFDKQLSSSEVQAIYSCGPDFQYNFKKAETQPRHVEFSELALGTRLCLLFNPRACTRERFVIDNSTNVSSKKTPQTNARMLQGTAVFLAHNVRDTLNCIGGVQVIFPLLKLLKDQWTIDYSMCARIISLLTEMLRYNRSNQESMVQENGFCTLGFILAQLDPKHINTSTLKALQGMLEVASGSRDAIVRDIFIDIFTNFELWIRVEFETQEKMLLYLRDEVSRNSDYFREIFGVQYLLDVLRYFFWYKGEKDAIACYNPPNRPSEMQLHTLRLHITEILKLILANGMNRDEVQAILLYCLDCQDSQQVIEMLKWILVLLDEEVPGLIDYVSEDKFYIPFFSLLKHEQRNVRILALKVLGKIVERASNDRKYRFETSGGYLMMEHCFLDEEYFTNETFTALVEIILDRVNYKISASLTVDVANETVTIARPALLHPFFQLIGEQHVKYRERALRTFNVLLKSSAANRRIFAEQFGWQNWLLQLMVPQMNPTADEGKLMKTVETLTIDTIIVVLSEQLLVKRGWKMVRDTMQFVSIVSERKDMHADSMNIDIFNQLLPIVVGYINKIEADKEKEFWKNLFHIVRIIEDSVLVKALATNVDLNDNANREVFERQVQLIRYLVLGFDYLIKMSLKEYKVMEILHCTSFAKGGRFGLQAIINLANDFTSAKGYVPDRTFFTMLFRMQLFLLENVSEKTSNDEKHVVRLMALLCQDIDHPRVPKPIFKTEVTDADTNGRRAYYVIASLLLRIQNFRQQNLVAVAKGVLRKKKAYFATTLIDQKAKEFIQNDLTGIDQDSEAEEFILSLKDEWDCVKESEPMASALKEVSSEFDTMYKKFISENTKRAQKIFQQIEKRSSNDIPVLKRVVEDSDQSKKYICYEELNRLNNWRHSQKRISIITLNEWAAIEKDLFSSGGVWHKSSENLKPQFQKLDYTENKNRMRMRLVVDPDGTNHPEASQKKSAIDDKDSDLLSKTSELASSIIKQPSEAELVDDEEDDEEDEREQIPAEEDNFTEEVKEDDWESVSKSTEESSFETLQKDTEYKIVLIAPCELILPLDSVKGNLEITSTHLYFIVNQEEAKDSQYNKKWPIAEIVEIFKRRYLLRHTAIEIFFMNKTNFFFNFETGDVLTIINTIVSQGANPRLHAYSYHPSMLIKKTKLTSKWQRREISNFEYLMALNTIANRTYNDLTQYPVFPWVIRDYESKKINLDNPSIYRNLSRPIGAQDDNRLKQLSDRYSCFVDPNIPPFHFGSHYSSVGTVLYYLIRTEPFTELSIKLQGGSFDLADRLFHSIPSTWSNIMKASSDCKELTPEWFYFPEFLRNVNNLNLGQKQNKEILGDAILPPWASSPEEFIRINKEALESDYVSENLHHWIDLIFGFKQIGEEAKKAYNVFYYLTYEGSVDLDKIQDPLLKKSIETQISNFGQTPTQLFKKPHPQRFPKTKVPPPIYWRDNAFIPFYSVPVYELDSDRGKPLLYIENIADTKMYVVNANRQLFVYNWMKPKPTIAYTQKIGNALATDVYQSNRLYACSKDGKWIFSCGHFDKSIKCSAVFDKLQVKQAIYHHKDIVTCMAVSNDGLYLVSGSIDATVNVYTIVHVETARTAQRIKSASAKVGNVIGNRYSRRSVGSLEASNDKMMITSQSSGALSAAMDTVGPATLTTSNSHPLSSQPLRVLYGHEVLITCVDVNSDIDTVVSGDMAGNVILHTLLEGTYVRTIKFSHAIDLVKISPEGHIVVHTSKNCMLYVFNLNGTMLSKMDTNDKLRTCTITADSKYVITGGMKKSIIIRQLYDLRELHAFEPLSGDVQAITLMKQDRALDVLATTTDGILHYLPLDRTILEREIVDLNPQHPDYIEVTSPTSNISSFQFIE